MEQDILMVIGPTAVGKSDFAVETALETGAEIISADAFQVYRGMDIGTAKITEAEMKGVPHHLIDILDPNKPYSVVEFVREAKAISERLISEGKKVIICGGTGLYIRAFLYDYDFPTPDSVDPGIRAALNAELDRHGAMALWKRLNEIDPKTAAQFSENNEKRLIRSLEIYEATGEIPSKLKFQEDTPRDDVKIVGLNMDREALYARINQRVLKMIDIGLVDEVRRLLETYETTSLAFLAIGYKEVIKFIDGGLGEGEMVDLIQQKTRNFAKRQLTWYRRIDDVEWIKTT